MAKMERTSKKTVFKRFVAVFCKEECKISKTEIKIKLGDLEEFTLKGTVILEQGWTKYDDYNSKDKILPNLDENIKNGNSLVDGTYAQLNRAVYTDISLMNKIKMFDWHSEFGDRGFDAIIGKRARGY